MLHQPTINGTIAESRPGWLKPALILIGSCVVVPLIIHAADAWPPASTDGVWIPLLTVLAVLALGSFTLAYSRKFILNAQKRRLIFALCVLLMTVILILPDVIANWFPAMSLIAAFLLPLFIVEAWSHFLSFAGNESPVWYPESAVVEQATFSLNRVPLSFRLRRSDTDANETLIPAMVPSRVALGKLFQMFIEDQNNSKHLPIQTEDGQDKTFGWHFYKQGGFGLLLTPLNPLLNSNQNGLSAGDVVAARRVSKQTKVPSVNQISSGPTMKKIQS